MKCNLSSLNLTEKFKLTLEIIEFKNLEGIVVDLKVTQNNPYKVNDYGFKMCASKTLTFYDLSNLLAYIR
jgi:hypothetical protein